MNLREYPIKLAVLEHLAAIPGNTGIEADDTGYRNVCLSPLDTENPDPIVALDEYVIKNISVYHHAAKEPLPFIYPFKIRNIRASEAVLMRKPAALAMVDQNKILNSYGCELYVIDGMRPAYVQQEMWALIFSQKYDLKNYYEQPILTRLSWCDDVERIGAHVAIRTDDSFEAELSRRRKSTVWNYFRNNCESAGIDPLKTMTRLLTYETNLGIHAFKLDYAAPTAHGNGGAADAWAWSHKLDRPVNLGVYYDYTGPACRLDFFEDEDNLELYRKEAVTTPVLKDYLAQFGVTEITRDIFNEIRDNRRLLYNSALIVGSTTYIEEPWHRNYSNELGGNQFSELPHSGNSCQALLRDIRDQKTGEWTACWTNETAHRLVAEKLAVT